MPGPYSAPFELSVANFVSTITSLGTPLTLQWLVSSTNFHMTLARFICSFAEEGIAHLMDLLLFLLSSGVDDATKWLNDLKDAGFERLVLAKAGLEQRRIEALQLLAYMQLQHLLVPGTVDMDFAATTMRTMGLEELDQARETLLKILPGVYHLAGTYSYSCHEASMGAYVAAFQVEPHSIEFVESSDITEDDDELLMNPHAVGLSNLDSESMLVKMRGIGKAVGEMGELMFVEVHAQLRLSSDGKIAFVAHVKGLDKSYIGSATKHGFSGDTLHWDIESDSADHSAQVPHGCFLFWKSVLPDTESNWNLHMRDINALHSARTTGIYGQRMQEFEKQGRWFKASQSTLSDIRKNSLYLNCSLALAIHSHAYLDLEACQASFNHTDTEVPTYLDPTLPRSRYESDRLYKLRNDIKFQVEQDFLTTNRNGLLLIVGSDLILQEAIAFGKSFVRLLVALMKPDVDPELVAAFEHVYEFLPTREYLLALINICNQAMKLIETAAAEKTNPELPSKIPSLIPLLEPSFAKLNHQYTTSHYNNPVRCAAGVSKLIDWMLKDEVSSNLFIIKPDSRFTEALATTDSALVRAMLTESQRLEAGNDFSRLYHKWRNLFSLSSASLDPGFTTLSPDAFFYCLAFASAGQTSQPIQSNEQPTYSLQREHDDYESDSGEDDDQQSLNLPTLLVGGAMFVVAITAGAFFLGRMLTRKRDQ